MLNVSRASRRASVLNLATSERRLMLDASTAHSSTKPLSSSGQDSGLSIREQGFESPKWPHCCYVSGGALSRRGLTKVGVL